MTEMTAPNTTTSRFDEDSLADFAKRNGRNLAIAGVVLVVLAAGFWIWQSSSRRKEAFASQELMQARASAEAGNLPLASSDLTRLTERFRGTRAADEAVVLLNQIRLVQGQKDVAIAALQEFVRGSHPDYVEASAYALLGGGLEDQGQHKAAAESYELASQRSTLDFLQAQYLIDAGRSFAVAGDTAAAKRSFGAVLDRFGRLDQAAEARVRMAEIGGVVPPMPKDTTEN